MKINAKQPSIKTYTLSHFKIGDVCMGVKNEHYYLVVKSEKEKKQLVDLTENEIIRDAGYMRFIPAIAELNIKDVALYRCPKCKSYVAEWTEVCECGNKLDWGESEDLHVNKN